MQVWKGTGCVLLCSGYGWGAFCLETSVLPAVMDNKCKGDQDLRNAGVEKDRLCAPG